ncbi:hypothetical protein CEXT_722761 [Caerostris extrusa]|uniref:Uncharacterized protein n=1 Tax=Caerostris extrusa TaxID=172846 RepID=A0AAV4QYH6_CAEEX|nr:hypothetical protein CEXT_722761 [Caerostris extrusa]
MSQREGIYGSLTVNKRIKNEEGRVVTIRAEICLRTERLGASSDMNRISRVHWTMLVLIRWTGDFIGSDFKGRDHCYYYYYLHRHRRISEPFLGRLLDGRADI